MRVQQSRTLHQHHDHFMDEVDLEVDDLQVHDDSDLRAHSKQILISLIRAALHEAVHTFRERDHLHRTLHELEVRHMLRELVAHRHLHHELEVDHSLLEVEDSQGDDLSFHDLSRLILQRLRLWVEVTDECLERALDKPFKKPAAQAAGFRFIHI